MSATNAPSGPAKKKAGKGHISIDVRHCKGCRLCIEACPRGAIEISTTLNAGGYYPAQPIAEAVCTACGLCWQVCPDVAIEVYRDVEEDAQ